MLYNMLFNKKMLINIPRRGLRGYITCYLTKKSYITCYVTCDITSQETGKMVI